MNAKHRRPHTSAAKWLPVAAAGALLAAVIAAGVVGGGNGGDAEAGAVSTFVAPATSEPVTAQTYEAVAEDEASTAVPKVPLTRNLSDGVVGDDVERVQSRLAELAFDPGPIDGIYGTMTKQAVWAFEKLVMEVPRQQATGVVSPAMWDRMQDPIKIAPRRPSGGLKDHTEIYLPEQAMVIFRADEPVLVTHVATGELDASGEPARYCETITIDTDAQGNLLDEPEEKPICGFSKTPAGVFSAYRKIEGTRNGPLGSMWNPIYINYGIAIHGALNVPLEPASHGCIRVPMHISEYMQDILEINDKVLVWDGNKEPEQMTEDEMLPVWDFRDPDATTTTTTSTTTTTLAPTTTLPAPTTTKAPPPATTTTAATPTTVAPTTAPPTTVAGGG